MTDLLKISSEVDPNLLSGEGVSEKTLPSIVGKEVNLKVIGDYLLEMGGLDSGLKWVSFVKNYKKSPDDLRLELLLLWGSIKKKRGDDDLKSVGMSIDDVRSRFKSNKALEKDFEERFPQGDASAEEQRLAEMGINFYVLDEAIK